MKWPKWLKSYVSLGMWYSCMITTTIYLECSVERRSRPTNMTCQSVLWRQRTRIEKRSTQNDPLYRTYLVVCVSKYIVWCARSLTLTHTHTKYIPFTYSNHMCVVKVLSQMVETEMRKSSGNKKILSFLPLPFVLFYWKTYFCLIFSTN